MEHQFFKNLIDLTIFVNTIFLSFEKYPADSENEKVLEYINLGFFVVFFIEMLLKLYVYGFRQYVKSNFNIFDAFIIIVSSVDILVNFIVSTDNESGGAVSVFRTFRLLRIFKLAKAWK